MSARERLETTGVWLFTDAERAGEAAELALRIEALGYSTLWLPETVGRCPFTHIAWLASQTTTLQFATGIANISHRHPGMMIQTANTLAEQSAGRFVLGLGVSHAPIVEGLRGLDYSKPLTRMREYLDAMDQSPYLAPAPTDPPLRVLAALGPKMLALSSERADGAHPYWTTPDHTRSARDIVGPDKLLCVEQKVVLTTDRSTAHLATNAVLEMYADLPNYRRLWQRLGFSDDEIDQRDARFLDAVVAWGDEAVIRARVDEHYAAGATHVCVQPIATDGVLGRVDWDVLEALAPANA